MNVSLTRKIHIIGLPHGTPLKARWSDDRSATMLLRPFAGSSASAVPAAEFGAMGFSLPTDR